MIGLGQPSRTEEAKGGGRAGESKCWGGFLGSLEPAGFTHCLQALMWTFKWVHCLPTGLGGAMGLVKVLKLLFIAHQ